jgi:hypothetical protein
VDDDVVMIRIGVANVLGHGALFLRGLSVFFAEVPIKGEFMAEPGDQFAEIEFAFHAERAVIERRSDQTNLTIMAKTVIVHFGFLEFEMEVEAESLRVIENDLPLIELRTVIMKLVGFGAEGPDVVTISADVIGEKREGVAAFAREIIERTDQTLAFAVLPCGIIDLPIL